MDRVCRFGCQGAGVHEPGLHEFEDRPAPPVLLQVPAKLGEYDEDEFPYVPVQAWKPQADPDDVKATVKLLLKAKNPVLYVARRVLCRWVCRAPSVC